MCRYYKSMGGLEVQYLAPSVPCRKAFARVSRGNMPYKEGSARIVRPFLLAKEEN